MASRQPAVYADAMSRFICLSIAAVLSLLSVTAEAGPVRKQPAGAFKGYGFLPGYHQPLNNALPLFRQEASVLRNARRPRRHWYIDPTPGYYRWSDGEHYYFGQPGFAPSGRYNGGSYGPCWTRTPIGAAWTCG
jgi:hypothetical protein